jgi:hypothetical protein
MGVIASLCEKCGGRTEKKDECPPYCICKFKTLSADDAALTDISPFFQELCMLNCDKNKV